MSIYNQKAIDNIFKQYEKHENFIAWTIPGALVDGYILTADGCKTTIIKEVYLNEWSSAYSVRMYNRIPAKYQKIIDMIEDEASNEEVIKAFCAA